MRGKHRYHLCNGKRQIVPQRDLPSFNADAVDAVIWEWVSNLLSDPKKVAAGLQAIREETDRVNQPFYDRLAIIESQISEYNSQLVKLLDLYLTGAFSREMLTE